MVSAPLLWLRRAPTSSARGPICRSAAGRCPGATSFEGAALGRRKRCAAAPRRPLLFVEVASRRSRRAVPRPTSFYGCGAALWPALAGLRFAGLILFCIRCRKASHAPPLKSEGSRNDLWNLVASGCETLANAGSKQADASCCSAVLTRCASGPRQCTALVAQQRAASRSQLCCLAVCESPAPGSAAVR